MERIKCDRCGHKQKRRSDAYIFRCSQCGFYKQLKKFPDRRFKKNQPKAHKRKHHRAKRKAKAPIEPPAA